MSLTDDLAAIGARAASATPGPWERVNPCAPDCRFCNEKSHRHGAQDYITSGAPPDEGNDWNTENYVEIVTCDSGVYGPALADAEFIVHARDDVPRLLRFAEALAARFRNVAGGIGVDIEVTGGGPELRVKRTPTWREYADAEIEKLWKESGTP